MSSMHAYGIHFYINCEYIKIISNAHLLKNERRDENFFISHIYVMQLHPQGSRSDYDDFDNFHEAIKVFAIIICERPRLCLHLQFRFAEDFAVTSMPLSEREYIGQFFTTIKKRIFNFITN